MRRAPQTKTERSLLSAIALLCYATTLTALSILGYSLAILAGSDIGQRIIALNPPY